MLKFILIFLLLPLQASADFDLRIQVKDVASNDPIQGVIVGLPSTSTIVTDRWGFARFKKVDLRALNDTMTLHHPDYHFDVNTIAEGEYDIVDKAIHLRIYGYKKMGNSYMMDVRIAKRKKSRNDSVYLSVFSNNDMKQVELLSPNGSRFNLSPKRYSFYSKLAYDDIKNGHLITKYSSGNRRISGASLNLIEPSTYIGPKLSSLKDDSENNLLKQYFETLDKHKVDIWKMERAHNREIENLEDSISDLHDHIYYLKTGRRPVEEIPEIEPEPLEPAMREDLIHVFYEDMSPLPEIGMGKALSNLEAILNQYSVKYCGDILIKLSVNDGKIVRFDFVHSPKHLDVLREPIHNYLNSLKWRPDDRLSDDGTDIGLTIKVKKR